MNDTRKEHDFDQVELTNHVNNPKSSQREMLDSKTSAHRQNKVKVGDRLDRNDNDIELSSIASSFVRISPEESQSLVPPPPTTILSSTK